MILFASLITAVLIPASVTAFVHAGSENERVHAVDDVTKNYVSDKINEIYAKKNTTSKDNYDLAKLRLVSEWIEATESDNIEEARHLSAQITADFPPDDECAQATPSSDVTKKVTTT